MGGGAARWGVEQPGMKKVLLGEWELFVLTIYIGGVIKNLTIYRLLMLQKYLQNTGIKFVKNTQKEIVQNYE